ncbi:CheR family methyltransferase [Sphingomonas quercus]|uniref:Chemotaxis protein methyltransferase n=1 Tax=Sphingomonas quercus TaxID=2842451 RepID=A0ABS6BFA9_9SPHN|nr:protein-glutamate O-methyltransferase [Sphingomonas quercus]MBU3076511.1 protein-glutamate O-methyltransferase [Sphingomonas quercus]
MSGAALLDAPAGSFAFSKADFAVIARIVHSQAGITLNESKMQLVYSRLAKFVRAKGMSDFHDYVALIQQDKEERQRAIFALTTNHTRLFREDHHFTHFEQVMRPAILAAAESGKQVRLWSSACSSGEEPYSLGMTLLGSDRAEAQRLINRNVAILATDLAPHVLATARAGAYPATAASDIPDRYRKLWTRISGDTMQMAPELMTLIAFRQLNLLDEWPIKVKFDAIFCRNVMIYFDDAVKSRLIERFAERLAPGGYLYIGHSERLVGPATNRFVPAGQTIYRSVA